MIIGFGFGSPLTALLMLIVTGFLSYSIFKALKGRRDERERYPGQHYLEDKEELKNKKREFYYEQRQRAWDMMREYNLTDEEIEKRVEDEFR
ncbi:MAG: hypothetical protein GX248_00110 [Peptococcaceae bacterium]|jgi:vacuolar-type H+-ATPase catalytic subunit A/Vma1|nr:hypothetical protein [Peptococcaceae bacterium]